MVQPATWKIPVTGISLEQPPDGELLSVKVNDSNKPKADGEVARVTDG